MMSRLPMLWLLSSCPLINTTIGHLSYLEIITWGAFWNSAAGMLPSLPCKCNATHIARLGRCGQLAQLDPKLISRDWVGGVDWRYSILKWYREIGKVASVGATQSWSDIGRLGRWCRLALLNPEVILGDWVGGVDWHYSILKWYREIGKMRSIVATQSSTELH